MRDETTETMDALLDVQQAMTQLTERQRQALTLWGQGFTQQEIGDRLGCCHQRVSQMIAEAAGLVKLLAGRGSKIAKLET